MFFTLLLISNFSLANIHTWVRDLFFILLAILGVVLLFKFFPESRITVILSDIFNKGFNKALLNSDDTSIQLRVSEISDSLIGTLQNYGLTNQLVSFINGNGIEQTQRTNQFSSGYGSMLFELGFLAIPLIVSIFNNIRKAFGKKELSML